MSGNSNGKNREEFIGKMPQPSRGYSNQSPEPPKPHVNEPKTTREDVQGRMPQPSINSAQMFNQQQGSSVSQKFQQMNPQHQQYQQQQQPEKKEGLSSVSKMTIPQAISVFKISKSTIYLWIKIYKEEGRLEHKRSPGRRPSFDASQMNELKQLVRQKPDATLAELAEHFGNTVSLTTIYNYLKSMGFRIKKNAECCRTESHRRPGCTS